MLCCSSDLHNGGRPRGLSTSNHLTTQWGEALNGEKWLACLSELVMASERVCYFFRKLEAAATHLRVLRQLHGGNTVVNGAVTVQKAPEVELLTLLQQQHSSMKQGPTPPLY